MPTGFNTELLVAVTGAAMVVAGVVVSAWAVRGTLRSSEKSKPRRHLLGFLSGAMLAVVGSLTAMKGQIDDSEWQRCSENIMGWVVPVFGTALMVVGATVSLRALFMDRPRGKKRCPRCWYDMSAANECTCPECGRIARSESRLLRTRRHWRLAALGVLIGVLGSTRFASHWIARGDYFPLIPTRTLISLIPSLRHLPAQASQELEWRLAVPSAPEPVPRLRLRALASLSGPTREALSRQSLKALETDPHHPARRLLFELMPEYMSAAEAPRIEPLVLAALQDPQPLVRLGAIRTLRRVQGFDQKKAVVAVAAMLRSASITPRAFGDDAVLTEAVAFLGACGAKDPSVVPALISQLCPPGSREGGWRDLHDDVLWTLSRLGPAAGTASSAVTAMSNPFPETDSDALAAYTLLIIQNREPTRRGALTEMVRRSEEVCRAFAVTELGREPDTLPDSMLLWAESDPSILVRLCAGGVALANKIDSDKLRPALRQAIVEGSDFGILERSIGTLARHGIDLRPMEELLHSAQVGSTGLRQGQIEQAIGMIDFVRARNPESNDPESGGAAMRSVPGTERIARETGAPR